MRFPKVGKDSQERKALYSVIKIADSATRRNKIKGKSLRSAN